VVIVLTPTTTLMEGFTNHLIAEDYSTLARELQPGKAFHAKAQSRAARPQSFSSLYLCAFA
jgi:hypothetical protein